MADLWGGAPSRRGRRVLAASGATVLLLAVVAAGGWIPRVVAGHSPVRPARAEPGGDTLDAAVEVARHEVRPRPGHPGVLHAGDERYEAVFDDAGFSFRPAGAPHAFELSLRGLTRGRRALPVDTGRWTGAANAALRDVASGVTERVTARGGEVEWDVVLAALPPGHGDLTVVAEVAGATGAPAREGGDSDPAWRLGLDGGSSVRLGEVVVLDARGAEVHRGLPRFSAGRVELTVPAAVLDDAAFPLTVDPTVSGPTTVSSSGNSPSVAFSGSVYLVVWHQVVAGEFAIWGRRLDADGAPLGPSFVIQSTPSSPSNQLEPDVAWNGSSFLVVWSVMNDDVINNIQGQRFSTAGSTVGPPMNISFTHNSRTPAVAASGTTFLVVWRTPKPGGSGFDILGNRITSSGTQLDFGSHLQIATDAKSELAPDVAGNGSAWLVAYQFDFSSTDPDLYARQVGGNGALGAPLPIATAISAQRDPAVASDGSQYQVVWEDNTSGNFDIRGARVSSAGAVACCQVVTDDAAGQEDPAIAYNGVFLVAWWDRRSGPDFSDLFGARVKADGTVQERNGFQIAFTTATEEFPAVTRGNGALWGVAYVAGPTITHRTVSPK